MRLSIRFPVFLILLLLASATVCASDDPGPQMVPSMHAIDVHNLHLAKTAQVSTVRMNIENHDFVGSMTFNGACYSPFNLSLDAYELVTKKKSFDGSGWMFDLPSMRKIFAAEMEKAGYPKYDPDLSLFETHLGSDADFSVAITLDHLRFKKCSSFSMGRTEGASNIVSTWEIYSQREQKVVFTKSVVASLEVPGRNAMPDRDFNKQLIAQMVDNMLSDPEFVAVFKPAP